MVRLACYLYSGTELGSASHIPDDNQILAHAHPADTLFIFIFFVVAII